MIRLSNARLIHLLLALALIAMFVAKSHGLGFADGPL